MAELVKIPISFFEITLDYERPDIRLLGDRAALVHALIEAWEPFDPSVDDIEVITSGKFSEQGVMLKLPRKQIAFFVGATFCRLSRGAVSWELTEETIRILDLSISTLVRLSGVLIGQRRTVMGMHLQPKSASFRDILRCFVPGPLAAVESSPIQTAAAVARWSNRAITLDGSATHANAVFLKMERTFPATASYEEIAKQLYNDELEMFSVMGVEEERP